MKPKKILPLIALFAFLLVVAVGTASAGARTMTPVSSTILDPVAVETQSCIGGLREAENEVLSKYPGMSRNDIRLVHYYQVNSAMCLYTYRTR